MSDVSVPDGLEASVATWRSVTSTYDLRPDELRVLEDACREMDLVDELESARRAEGFAFLVRGSQGQQVANPILSELRQHRSALRALLKQLNLPDGEGRTSTSSQARAAANARWRRGA